MVRCTDTAQGEGWDGALSRAIVAIIIAGVWTISVSILGGPAWAIAATFAIIFNVQMRGK